MPTVKELESLVNYSRFDPAIDAGYFPNLPGANTPSLTVWSWSPYAGNPADAWFVAFYGGNAGNAYRASGFAVWLVRGGQ
jgi:hypothetical protein